MKPRRSFPGVPFWNALLLGTLLLAGDAALRYGRAQQEPGPPKVLTAQEFRLVDKDGKTRAALAVKADGSPGLLLYDGDGKVRAALRVRSDGSAALSLHDPDGSNRAALDTQSNGSASLTLTNKSGKGGVGLAVLPDGKAGISVTDKEGKVVGSVP